MRYQSAWMGNQRNPSLLATIRVGFDRDDDFGSHSGPPLDGAASAVSGADVVQGKFYLQDLCGSCDGNSNCSGLYGCSRFKRRQARC